MVTFFFARVHGSNAFAVVLADTDPTLSFPRLSIPPIEILNFRPSTIRNYIGFEFQALKMGNFWSGLVVVELVARFIFQHIYFARCFLALSFSRLALKKKGEKKKRRRKSRSSKFFFWRKEKKKDFGEFIFLSCCDTLARYRVYSQKRGGLEECLSVIFLIFLPCPTGFSTIFF